MKKRTMNAVLLVVLVVATASLLLYRQTAPTTRTSSVTETRSGETTTSQGRGSSASGSSSTTSNTIATTAQYRVSSPPTGQWTVIRATSAIISVSASDTGTIPAYKSLASLNETSIGYQCAQLSGDGACGSFKFVQQTGWFWDPSSSLLTVHYLGGANVTLTVVEQP